MENTADETSLFCLEIFVDTVDYLQLSTDAKQPEPTDFVFIFAGYPPLVVPAPDTIAQPNAASWVTTRLGKKRYRVTYQSGKSALFEAQPTDLAAKLRCRPLQVLALSSEDAEIGTASGRPHRRLRGSCAVPMAGYHPPAAGGWQRLGGKGSVSWGCDERAVPVKDSLERTVAVALVVVTVSAMNGQLKDALIQNVRASQQRGSSQAIAADKGNGNQEVESKDAGGGEVVVPPAGDARQGTARQPSSQAQQWA